MSGGFYRWQCCFCDREIHPSPPHPWMTEARAICLVNGHAHLSDAKFEAHRCNYIHNRWLGLPDSQVVHLVHSRCWEFFTRHFNDAHLDLNKLFHVISSTQKMRYGKSVYRPMDRLAKQWHPFTTGFTYLGAPLPSHTKQVAIRESGAGIHANPADPFSCLPVEIMEEIADCTDMVDYLNLRLASRVMASLFHTQTFWRHRFNIHMERGFLNCLLEEDQNRGRLSKEDWHQIYYKTQPSRMLRMEDRKSCQRILAKYWFWLRLSWIRDICVGTKISYMPLSKEEQRVTTDACWHTVKGRTSTASKPWIPKQPKECEITESIILPKAFSRIGFWVFQAPTRSFIAGMEFMTDSMIPNKAFGYRVPGKKHIIDIGSRERFRGFEICFERQGIRAIRVCTTRPISASKRPFKIHTSGWVGSPGKGNQYQAASDIYDLVSRKEIFVIQAGSEDYRLSSLAIGTCLVSSTETRE